MSSSKRLHGEVGPPRVREAERTTPELGSRAALAEIQRRGRCTPRSGDLRGAVEGGGAGRVLMRRGCAAASTANLGGRRVGERHTTESGEGHATIGGAARSWEGPGE
ncbi:unnamed protein product [Prorocentrum cordatum]|uniref:Uncharacterized protein n=1 Tax=Prorocentrum cordatum TaxID=2364126 RepID=A0ABN9YDG1_9DINO|nr:unnamed protein product [Polarella glacialis]